MQHREALLTEASCLRKLLTTCFVILKKYITLTRRGKTFFLVSVVIEAGHGISILRFSHLVKTLQNFLISILAVHFGTTIIVNGLRWSKFMVGTCQSQLSVVLSLIWRRQASPSHLTPLSQATHNRVVLVFIFLFIFLIRLRSDHSLPYLNIAKGTTDPRVEFILPK